MKAKLVKNTVGEYQLIVDKVSSNSIDFFKLSLKNCQTIERGYDLDELASKEYLDGYDSTKFCRLAFKDGFQKALELMGDKKFSEKDVRKAIDIARNGSMQEQHNGYGRPTELRFVLDNTSSDEIIQSLQQTEWDVEVEMQRVKDETKIIGAVKGVKGSGNKITIYKSVPKLDADGCLILKRI